MKEFRSYWKKNKRWIGISFSFAVIFTVILMLYDIPADTVWYAFALCFSVEVILLAVDFVKYYGKCKRMEEQYLNINICVPEDGEPEELVERYYQEMVNTLFEGKAKIESDNNIARKEMLDYYSLWVHQIKTPIAAMRILLQVRRFHLKNALSLRWSCLKLNSMWRWHCLISVWGIWHQT